MIQMSMGDKDIISLYPFFSSRTLLRFPPSNRISSSKNPENYVRGTLHQNSQAPLHSFFFFPVSFNSSEIISQKWVKGGAISGSALKLSDQQWTSGELFISTSPSGHIFIDRECSRELEFSQDLWEVILGGETLFPSIQGRF